MGDAPARGVTVVGPSDVEDRTTEVEDEIARLCGTVNAAHARLVELTAVALREKLWHQHGIVSPAHWLRWKTGLSVARSEAMVRLAQRLDDLPATAHAFSRGELSIDQVGIIARHVPASYDTAAAQLATQLMVPQLASALRSYRFDPEPPASDGDGTDEQAPAPSDPGEPRTYLSYGHRDDDTWAINGRLAAEDGSVVARALEAAHHELFRQRQAERDDGRPVEVTGIDRLLHLCDLAAGADKPRHARERFRVLVHLDADTLEESEAGRRPALHLGPVLGRSIVDRLSCDTDIQTVLERRGLAVAYGPRHPNIADRIRQLVEQRDQGCRFPGCHRRTHLEVHHLVRRIDGGWTAETNLICLCPTHHRAHHRGQFTITGDPTTPTGLEFRTRHGDVLSGPARARPDPHLDPPAGTWRHPPGYPLQRRWFHLEPRPPSNASTN